MNKSLSLFTTLGLFASSQAATLTWSDDPFTDSAQVNNIGTTLYAHNMGSVATINVNGVDFTGQTAASIASVTNLRWGTSDAATANAGGLYGGALGVSGLSASDETTLLDNIVYGNNQGAGFQFEGLTIGEAYVAQFIVVDNRGGFTGRSMHFSQDGSTWAGALVDYTSNPSAPGPNNWARVVTTSFVADSTTQTFRFGIQGIGSPEASAMQLRQIPEPSTTVLFVLGSLGLCGRRRRLS